MQEVYKVQVVEDEQMPDGYEWVLTECAGGTVLFVARSAHGPRVMAEAWAGYRMLDRRHTPCRPSGPPDRGRSLLRVV